ncbi:MAG: hypothetical protein KF773_11675 [Deltaproteobacteria bacterium]|nr:hypothetical protein [Deltaproteobacteria bacterium]MCW5809029.1 hypothetical protein [Deltaproteobacteria bacterium]
MRIRCLDTFALALALSTAAACGGGGGGGDDDPDIDAPSTAPITITVSGQARELTAGGANPVEGVAIAAFKSSDEATPIATATTDAQGMYSLTVMTDGPLDGYIRAKKAGLVDTYLYAPAPLDADFSNGSINMVSKSTYDLLSTLCQANQDAAKGTIAVLVADGIGTDAKGVMGATVASTPAATKVCYNSGGLPSAGATATATDGIAYLFNVTGEASVSATKAGSTFKSHGVKARAGTLTTTPITP